MRLTLTRKVVLGIAVILALGALAILLVYQGLAQVQQALVQLADVREPLSTATHEMEINVNGMTLGVLRYLAVPKDRYRRLVEKDERDLEAFHARYLRLAETEREQALGRRAGLLFQELKAVGRGLMARRDRQEELLTAVEASLEKIDELIDKNLRARIDPRDPDRLVKLQALGFLEAEQAEVSSGLAHYLRTHQGKYRRLIAEKEREFRAALARVLDLPLTPDERRWVRDIEKEFDEGMIRLNDVLALEGEIRGGANRLLKLRAVIDDLLDEEMQAQALDDLRRPRQEADAAVSQALVSTRWLASGVLLWALGVTLVLVRSINRPLTRLRQGTEAVAGGDLGFRIVPVSRDELADLAGAFNHMVAQLQATTVSKEALEASERRLRDTVGQLRQEIAERQRAEEEQARLQASLRHAETMSALGALVGGVAHQVRNPLFGISSVVDAMDARFGRREEYRRYLGFLREPVGRLSTLMQELLEYGKPPTQELAPASLDEVVGEAVRSCRPLADRLGLQVFTRIESDPGPVAADPARLVRALQNLLENALQHAPPGSAVRVEVRRGDRDGRAWVECAVADGGPGFRPEDLPRAFEPFFTRRRGGTGLGLAIVQRIVEEHGGQAEAANGPEGGAVVTVRLPLLEPQASLGGASDGRGPDPGD